MREGACSDRTLGLRPDCRIQNAVYMVGEKGADLIKAAHRDLYWYGGRQGPVLVQRRRNL